MSADYPMVVIPSRSTTHDRQGGTMPGKEVADMTFVTGVYEASPDHS
jgi:hypothetical protein